MERYPLKLTFHVREYSFGERLIPERLGKEGVPDGVVAETWEVSDYRDAPATVTNGEYAGRTLHELVEESPDELVGDGWRGPHFPILLKFLDASHMLPVHLHPDDETAKAKHGEPHGKSEAWHILWAKPDASILAGIKEGFSREDLFDAFKRQDYDRVMPRYPITAGDTVYVPGGILHTFGPGTLIAEVQQTSDLGQFVMPEDLYGTPLGEDEWNANIEATLDELKTNFMPRPNPGLVLEDGENRKVLCCAGPNFALERWTLAAASVVPARPDRFTTLSNVGEGDVLVEHGGGQEILGRAESCVLPAALGAVEVVPEGDGEASVVACYVPDMDRDVVGPSREAGYSDEGIRGLGQVDV